MVDFLAEGLDAEDRLIRIGDELRESLRHKWRWLLTEKCLYDTMVYEVCDTPYRRSEVRISSECESSMVRISRHIKRTLIECEMLTMDSGDIILVEKSSNLMVRSDHRRLDDTMGIF